MWWSLSCYKSEKKQQQTDFHVENHILKTQELTDKRLTNAWPLCEWFYGSQLSGLFLIRACALSPWHGCSCVFQGCADRPGEAFFLRPTVMKKLKDAAAWVCVIRARWLRLKWLFFMTKACCTDALSEQSIDYSEKQAAATKQYVGVVKKKTKAVQSGDGLSQ